MRALVALCSVTTLVTGCPVDQRELQPALLNGGSSGAGGTAGSSGNHGGGRAGSSGGGAGGAAAAGSQQDAGAAGDTSVGGGDSEPSYPPLIDGCVDLDENDIADCEETLAVNADFKTGTEGWQPDLTAVLSWLDRNAFGATPSGSARVAAVGAIDQDGSVQAASSQCVPVAAGQTLEVFANFFIEPDQGAGLAALGVLFFDAIDCQGNLKEPLVVSRTETGLWSTLKSSSQIPDGVTSMRVRLAVSKPYRLESFEVLFDNVLVRVH